MINFMGIKFIYKVRPESKVDVQQIAFQRNGALFATNIARNSILLYYKSITKSLRLQQNHISTENHC